MSLATFVWHIHADDNLTDRYSGVTARAFRRDDDGTMIAAMNYMTGDYCLSIHFPNAEAVTAIIDKLEDLACQIRDLQEQEATVGSD